MTELENKGMYARYVDHMGSDLTVVNAARVSFAKEHKEFDGVRDTKLINYLSSHDHFTPFTHCTITLVERVPIFVARQRFKHTVGFTYNEVSRRYVDDEPEFFEPEVWRGRAENKKQGSSDEQIELLKMPLPVWTKGDGRLKWVIKIYHGITLGFYKALLFSGIAPEQARMVLPQSMYTEYYVTGSLQAWARAYNLRSDEHAQKEIQDLAALWSQIIKPLYPVSWKELTK